MSRLIKDDLAFLIIWMGFLIIFFIRYRFPHFCMHFGDGVRRFSFGDLGILKKCKLHTNKDIESFQAKQKIMFMTSLVIGIFLIIGYIILRN